MCARRWWSWGEAAMPISWCAPIPRNCWRATSNWPRPCASAQPRSAATEPPGRGGPERIAVAGGCRLRHCGLVAAQPGIGEAQAFGQAPALGQLLFADRAQHDVGDQVVVQFDGGFAQDRVRGRYITAIPADFVAVDLAALLAQRHALAHRRLLDRKSTR